MKMRIGHGYDLHRLESGKKFVVCGETIAFDKGCAAHSDGDVVYHAVTDAILGALGLEDIGQLFPDTQAKWEGQDSSLFVEEAARLMKKMGFEIVNLDITLVLEKPKMSGYKMKMKDNLAYVLNCDIGCVNLKAKTHEKVDAVGRGEAVECHVVVLLKK